MATLFFSSHAKDSRFFNYGSSKEILIDLFKFIEKEKENLSEIYLCLYLYNNEILHNKMKELALSGISVKVISLPLEGYDTKYPKDIYDPQTNTVLYQNATKYSLAQKVYNDIIGFNNRNYMLYVFGHTYVRSSRMKNFARGTLPYSLHTKSFFFKLRDGRTITGLTSSNLAVRDVSKDELMILMDDTPQTRQDSELFFQTLLKNSTLITEWKNPNPNFCYHMDCIDTGIPACNYFASPFFTDSPVRMAEKITSIIRMARQRIYVCAEHLAAYNYRDLSGNIQPGLFHAIFEKCQNGIPVRCLSQTYVDANGYSHGQRSPQNTAMFRQLIKQMDRLPQCFYAVNKNVHAKFIVVDNTIIVSTANYTPTEFLYGPVKIDRFESPELAGVTYDGIFSEVSHFIILEDANAAEQLIRFFHYTVNQEDTFIHNQKPPAPAHTAAQTSGSSYTPLSKTERYYIHCPYAEKDQAKSLGAKWDPARKQWYYTSPDQEHLFRRWL